MATDDPRRRVELMARAEIFVRDPWAAAALVCLGEKIARIEPRRDNPQLRSWVFRNPHGTTAALVNALYEQSPESLVPIMLFRAAYRSILAATTITDIPEPYRDTTAS